MKKTLMILPFLIFAASCSKENKTPEDSTVYQTISFENHTFADKKHNNFPSASGIDSTYTEFGATFTAQNYYYFLSGILIADDYEKPQLEGEFIAYSNGKRVVCNKDFEEGKEPPMGADGTSKYSVWSYSQYNKDVRPSFSFADGVEHKAVSMKVNNDAMAWQYMKIGFYSKPAFTTGDYFEAIFTGYDASGNETGKVTVPLGDFRDGKSLLVEDWQDVDISPLGMVNKIVLTADFSDNFMSFMYVTTKEDCPYMVCVDEIKFDITEEAAK